MTPPRSQDNSIAYRQWLPAVVLVLVGIGLYSNIFSAPFVFDSAFRIRDNVNIRQLWPPWGWFLYSQRPIAYFTLALNYALHGYQLWGYHAVNLAIHITASLVLFALLKRTFNAERLANRYSGWPASLALAISLLWLAHPLQTQAVTYTIQRMESLMGLFYLLTLYGLIRSKDSPHPIRWLFVSSYCCWLGMATKEVTATAPLIALGYDRMFIAKSWRDIWTSRRWYHASLLASWTLLVLLITQFARYGDNAIQVNGITPLDYAKSQPGVILHYLRLFFWPVGQNLDYGWPVPASAGAVVLPAMVLAGLLAATVWSLFRRPVIGFLGACFFLILAPTSSVMPIVDLAFEHRMYLPLAVVCTLTVVAAVELWRRLPPLASLSSRALTTSALAALFTSATMLGALTYLRNQDYRSAISIWSDVVQKSPHHSRGYNNLGTELLKVGRIDEAIPYFERVLAMNPQHVDAHSNLGMALTQKGQLNAAIDSLEAAIEIDPEFAIAHDYLGIARTRNHQIDEAIQSFRTAIALNPSLASPHLNLGTIWARQGQIEQALEHFEMAVRLDPHDANTHYNYGSALHQRGQLGDAMRHYALALQLDPTYANAHFKLGLVRMAQHPTGHQAASHFEQALRLNSNHRRARAHLVAWHFQQARTAAGQQQWEKALQNYRRIIQLVPHVAEVHHEFGEVLLARGQLHTAIQYFREAVRLKPDFEPAKQHLQRLTKEKP